MTSAKQDERLTREAIELARRWVRESRDRPGHRAATRLSELLKDPGGLAFAVGFIDGVVRPEDRRVAARNWRSIVRSGLPRFLPWHLSAALRIGAISAWAAPHVVVPVATRVLQRMVGHLVLDASPRRLGRGIAHVRASGMRPNVNLLGEAVLGSKQASRRLAGTRELLARPDVDYVSVKVSSVVAPHSPWAFDESVEDITEALLPLFEEALRSSPQKFINLDMEEYRDLDLTLAVFTTILDRPELLDIEAGIVLQAYLPDSMQAMVHIQEWAADRRSRGGAGVKVRIVKGANLPMEGVESELRSWPLATWASKQDSDTHYKRLIDYAFEPQRIKSVRIGVAGHNLFDLAWAWQLAGERQVRDGVEFEMLLGMAPAVADAVRAEVGGLLVYTPVVHSAEFDVAIAYLVRRLEEGATPENFMSSLFDLADDEVFAREEKRFVASLENLDSQVPPTNRAQDRLNDAPRLPIPAEFVNTPDTDPSLGPNRRWGRQITGAIRTSKCGFELVAHHTLESDRDLDRLIEAAQLGGRAWSRVPPSERAHILRRAAVELERDRARLLEVMAAECGKTLEQGDPEVSEAVDFACFYADRTDELDKINGAEFHPRQLTVVTPPWNFPVAIPAGSTLAALAAGSAVIIKPAPQARRSGSVMVQALWRAGIPREALHLAHVEESGLAQTLITDPRVDQVILTGAYETAELFYSLRPDLRLFAETSGKNAIVITPSADYDLAVKDLVASAFGHAGQKCSAASLAILVGSAGQSTRLRTQLIDAIRSLTVGYPDDRRTQVGPLIEPATGKLLRVLTTLAPSESWLIEPRQVDSTGRLWTPGLLDGVRPGSAFHQTEYFGPVLGIMRARTLAEAIALQNAVPYGLTAGLHSLDIDEQNRWIEEVQAGNLYVNRGITGAIVQRQPFGGWKRSAIGPGAKAGGPNYLLTLGSWTDKESDETSPLDDLGATIINRVREWRWDHTDVAHLEAALRSDRRDWESLYRTPADSTALTVERNMLRYLPTPVTVRLTENGKPRDLLRVAAAGLRTGAKVTVSTDKLDPSMQQLLETLGASVRVENNQTWQDALTTNPPNRIRIVGRTTDHMHLHPTPATTAIWDHPVTSSGRVEMLPFLHEQAISITNHRFGTVRSKNAAIAEFTQSLAGA